MQYFRKNQFDIASPMNYEEALHYLYNETPMFQKTGSSAYKEGLENTYALDSYFGRPHQKFRTIHVAGTNGKGSVSHLLAAVLQQAGYRTGLYTSPHLKDFRERIRVNGQPIPENLVTDYVNNRQDFFRTLQPSFFELTTSMAFLYFAESGVDVAVIEVGLGGRLDCTNIITPDLSVITNISFDHTALLGNTLSAIAGEKAGIIKPGIPVVVGETTEETKAVFVRKAKEVSAPVFFAEEEYPLLSSRELPDGKRLFDFKSYPGLIGELGGLAQEKNASTVLCAIDRLKERYNLSRDLVYRGFDSVLEMTGLQGRWQIIQENPRIILDTAHNPAGMEYIVRQLRREHFKQLHIVIGMVNDKDVRAVLKLLPEDARYYFTKASISRALNEKELARIAGEFHLRGELYPSVEAALEVAKSTASSDDLIFVGGSTFVVADALSIA